MAPAPRRALFACCSPELRLARALEALSVEFESVPSAREVDARVAAWRPAFVVLDLDMTGADMTGADMTGAAEAAFCLPEVDARRPRVVLLASASSVFLAMKCLRSRRADHVLMKPADVDELAALLAASSAAAAIPRLPSLERIQWEYIQAVLGSCGGNVSEAARQLGIYRQSLQRMLRRHPPGR